MRKLTHFRFCILFLVLGLLLSFGLTGCNDDHDYSVSPGPTPAPTVSPEPSPEPSPVPTGKISYLFLQDAARKVSADAAEAAVTAYDAEGRVLEGASLEEASVASMKREGDFYVAEANVPETAELLAFTFTHGDDVDGVYAIALTDGVERYVMAYSDLVAVPELTVYADAGHSKKQTAFTLGEALYPEAKAATRGGLAVPVASVEPVDGKVVAYTPGSAGQEAAYEAAGEGQTAFVIAYAEAEVESAAVVTVSEVPPVSAWILSPNYELKNGKIYEGETLISDPAAIEAKQALVPGSEAQCLLVAADGGSGADASYKLLDAAVTAEITSDSAAHFSAAVKNGVLTVSVSAEAEKGETAAVVCSAEGYAFQNRAEAAVATTRTITVCVPCASYPSYNENEKDVGLRLSLDAPPVQGVTPRPVSSPSSGPVVENLIRIAAIGAGDQAIPGAQLAEEDTSKMSTEQVSGDTCWVLKAEVPENAETVLLLYDLRSTFSGVTRDAVAPYFAFKLTEAEDYVMTQGEWFLPVEYYGEDFDQPSFGTHANADFTAPTTYFGIGDQVYFCPTMTNYSNRITVKVSELKSWDTSVIDENFKAVGEGTVWFTGSWYGVEGAVFPGTMDGVRVYAK